MELLNYHLNKNEDGTYSCSYDYTEDSGQSFHVDMPRVKLIYEMESLINKENIIFPNIKGHIILN